MTAFDTSLASPEVRRDEHLHSCPRYAGIGIRHWLDGQSLQLVSG